MIQSEPRLRFAKWLAINTYRFFVPFFYKKYREKHQKFDRIYHIHIRKCAGTSLNNAFMLFLRNDKKLYEKLARKYDHHFYVNRRPIVGWNKYLLEYGCYWYGFSHIPYHSLTLPNKTFTFTFFRDPFERIVSHYNMINELIKINPNHPALKKEKVWVEGGFTSFLKNIPREDRENQLFMFDSNFNIDNAISAANGVDYVGNVKTIQHQFIPFLSSELQIDLPYTPLRISQMKYQPTEKEEYLGKTMLKREYEFYDELHFSLAPYTVSDTDAP